MEVLVRVPAAIVSVGSSVKETGFEVFRGRFFYSYSFGGSCLIPCQITLPNTYLLFMTTDG